MIFHQIQLDSVKQVKFSQILQVIGSQNTENTKIQFHTRRAHCAVTLSAHLPRVCAEKKMCNLIIYWCLFELIIYLEIDNLENQLKQVQQMLSQLLPHKILGGKTLKNVQIDPQTTDIWPKQLIVTLSVREWVNDALIRESNANKAFELMRIIEYTNSPMEQ